MASAHRPPQTTQRPAHPHHPTTERSTSMKIEVWTHTPHGYLQRIYGSVDTALEAARTALKDGKAIQIHMTPVLTRPVSYDETP